METSKWLFEGTFFISEGKKFLPQPLDLIRARRAHSQGRTRAEVFYTLWRCMLHHIDQIKKHEYTDLLEQSVFEKCHL